MRSESEQERDRERERERERAKERKKEIQKDKTVQRGFVGVGTVLDDSHESNFVSQSSNDAANPPSGSELSFVSGGPDYN